MPLTPQVGILYNHFPKYVFRANTLAFHQGYNFLKPAPSGTRHYIQVSEIIKIHITNSLLSKCYSKKLGGKRHESALRTLVNEEAVAASTQEFQASPSEFHTTGQDKSRHWHANMWPPAFSPRKHHPRVQGNQIKKPNHSISKRPIH